MWGLNFVAVDTWLYVKYDTWPALGEVVRYRRYRNMSLKALEIYIDLTNFIFLIHIKHYYLLHIHFAEIKQNSKLVETEKL